MTSRIEFDGTEYKIEQTTQKEDKTIKQLPNQNEVDVQEPSELKQVIEEFNRDEIEPGKRTSTIDMKAQLTDIEAISLVQMDSLISIGLLPSSTGVVPNQKKRISVSINARGRDDAVAAVAGERGHREETASGGIKGFFGRMFKGGQ